MGFMRRRGDVSVIAGCMSAEGESDQGDRDCGCCRLNETGGREDGLPSCQQGRRLGE